ncbi:MAG: protein-L-isoaspartate O-methyltransferase [Patescibacteria group bacterium]
MAELIQKLIDDGYLKTERVIAAFRTVHRVDFLTPELRSRAEENVPLPTDYGQTISQPLTVAFMLELLQVKRGDVVLDVGSGSGWQTALLAYLTGEQGRVYAIERIPGLQRAGAANIAHYGFQNVTLACGDGSRGYKPGAPYDRIIVAAAAEIGIPDVLINQLKVGGRLVIPVGKYEQDMVVVNKMSDNDFREQRFPGFQFVPLVPTEWGK